MSVCWPRRLPGLDVRAVREGAAAALAPVLANKPPKDVPAALGAALSFAGAQSGKTIAVMMAYADRLERFTRWYVQLWAESLGKDGKGTTPLAALGPVDQHSQQQLFIAGPRDKLVTVITVDTAGLGPTIESKFAKEAGEPDFAGKTIGDLVAAQSRAMVETFARNSCPTRTMHLKTLDETSLGELLMHFMLRDHHHVAPARGRSVRSAGGGRSQGAGEEISVGGLASRCRSDLVVIAAAGPGDSSSGIPDYWMDARARAMRCSCDWPRSMIRITDSISIDDSEISETFVRASGPGGQNVNKLSTAVQLRFDARRSPSLPNDVSIRLQKLAGKRLTRDGIIVIIAQQHRTQERNRQDARDRLVALIQEAAVRPTVRRADQADQKLPGKTPRGQENRLGIKALRRERPSRRASDSGAE